MHTTPHPLTTWAIEKIRAEYPNDVALLVGVSGHSVNGDAHGECFDYFVPATERGNELAQDFIIDGVGHDLYPRDWARTERTANLDDWATMCLGNAVILYSRSPEDTARFEALRAKLFANLKDPAFVYQKALQWLNVGMDQYRTLMFDDSLSNVRTAACYVHKYLAMAVYFLNGTYESDFRDGRIPHLARLPALPERFIEQYRALMDARDIDTLRAIAHEIIRNTRAFISAHRPARTDPQPNPDYRELAMWYEEMSLTCRRIRHYCAQGNVDAAFNDACQMQKELTIVQDEYDLRGIDLMSSWDSADLRKVSDQSAEVERQIVQLIESHGAKVRSYATMADFLREN